MRGLRLECDTSENGKYSQKSVKNRSWIKLLVNVCIKCREIILFLNYGECNHNDAGGYCRLFYANNTGCDQFLDGLRNEGVFHSTHGCVRVLFGFL